MTEGVGYKRGQKHLGMKIEFIDIRRAYYQATARRKVYVELPDGDNEEGICALLRKSLQGTRDAAQCWEHEYVNFMQDLGFAKGVSTPCVFYHTARNLRAVIHGDDFTILGYDDDLDWFRTMIEAK